MDNSLYNIVRSHLNDNKDAETLISICQSLLDRDLENRSEVYQDRFGKPFDTDDGLVQYLVVMINVGMSVYDSYDQIGELDFDRREFVRSVVLDALSVITSNVKTGTPIDNVSSAESLIYYLQDKDIVLTRSEYSAILHYHNTELASFISGVSQMVSRLCSEKIDFQVQSVLDQSESSETIEDENSEETSSENNVEMSDMDVLRGSESDGSEGEVVEEESAEHSSGSETPHKEKNTSDLAEDKLNKQAREDAAASFEELFGEV